MSHSLLFLFELKFYSTKTIHTKYCFYIYMKLSGKINSTNTLPGIFITFKTNKFQHEKITHSALNAPAYGSSKQLFCYHRYI